MPEHKRSKRSCNRLLLDSFTVPGYELNGDPNQLDYIAEDARNQYMLQAGRDGKHVVGLRCTMIQPSLLDDGRVDVLIRALVRPKARKRSRIIHHVSKNQTHLFEEK